jgi:hypothetical protein
MTDTLRVILEIDKKRRVVARAMDWPGLDRWDTSEEDTLERLLAASQSVGASSCHVSGGTYEPGNRPTPSRIGGGFPWLRSCCSTTHRD